MTEDIKNVTRTGLILAVTLILQGLRLVIPIPPQVSMFVVGSLVNACLIVAVLTVGRRAGLVVAACTPVFAWLEGMLPFFPFVFPVALGNSFYVWAAWRLGGLALAAVRPAGFLRRRPGQGGHPLRLFLPALCLHRLSAGCAAYALVCHELASGRDGRHRGCHRQGSEPLRRFSS